MEGRVVFVEGIPGCGKTSFCKSYAAMMNNVEVMEEWVDEKILAEYLADMPNKAFDFQMRAQTECLKKLDHAQQLASQGKIVLIDRGIMGNRCFAELQYSNGFISETNMTTYRKLYNHDLIKKYEMCEVWYLICDVQVALQRIESRNREGESSYTFKYLSDLKIQHDLLLSPTKIVDMNPSLKISSEGLFDLQGLKGMEEISVF